MDMLQLVSIFIEFVIVIISLMIAIKNKKQFGYGFALTFGIYVLYDLAKLFSFTIRFLRLQKFFIHVICFFEHYL